MKKEVAKWQNSPDMMTSPLMTPAATTETKENSMSPKLHARAQSVDKIPLLSEDVAGSTGLDSGTKDVVKERKIGDLPA